MKKSSVFILAVVLLLFLGVEGAFVFRAFIAPPEFSSLEAKLLGRTVSINNPVQGIVEKVYVLENQRVQQGQSLFIIRPTSDTPTGTEPLVVTALRSGTVTSVTPVEGALVQADQLLARIVDNSFDSLYVHALLLARPEQAKAIRPLLIASVRAPYLNDNRPVRGIVTSTDPVYDAATQTLGVRVRLLQRVPGIGEDLPVGLPVTVTVTGEASPRSHYLFAWFRTLLPTSQARPE